MTTTMTTTMTDTPRIYVACLASYNGGTLHGAWVDADRSAGEIWADVQTMLRASRDPFAEEWAIHDHEGFQGWNLGESESFARVAQVAELLDEHGEAFGAWLDYHGGDVDYAADSFADAFCGEFTAREFADEWIDSGCLGDVPEHLAAYIDVDAVRRDLFCGDFTSIGAYVFRSV